MGLQVRRDSTVSGFRGISTILRDIPRASLGMYLPGFGLSGFTLGLTFSRVKVLGFKLEDWNWEDLVVSQNRGPQYRPQNTIVLIIRTPKKSTPNFGKLPFRV